MIGWRHWSGHWQIADAGRLCRRRSSASLNKLCAHGNRHDPHGYSTMLPVIQLPGADVPSKQAIAAPCRCRAWPPSLPRTHRTPASADGSDIELFARLWQRESLLLATGALPGYAGHRLTHRRMRAGCAGEPLPGTQRRHLLPGIREMWPRVGRVSVAFDVEKPTTEEQVSAWTKALGAKADDLPGIVERRSST